jgi:hypothetical protein
VGAQVPVSECTDTLLAVAKKSREGASAIQVLHMLDQLHCVFSTSHMVIVFM